MGITVEGRRGKRSVNYWFEKGSEPSGTKGVNMTTKGRNGCASNSDSNVKILVRFKRRRKRESEDEKN